MCIEKLKEIVSDAEMNDAWANADFGTMKRRDVLRFALLKYACGYYSGATVRAICIELELLNARADALTIKGKAYLYQAFNVGNL